MEKVANKKHVKTTIGSTKFNMYILMLSIFTAAGISISLPLYKGNSFLNNTNIIFDLLIDIFFSLDSNRTTTTLIAVGIFGIIYYVNKLTVNKTIRNTSLIWAVLISVFQIIGTSLSQTNSFELINASYISWIKAIWKMFSLCILFYYTFVIVSVFLNKETTHFNATSEITSKKFLKYLLIGCIAYIPYFIVFYPGVVGTDTFIQGMQYYGYWSPVSHLTSWYETGIEYTITNHNPAFLTLFFGMFFSLGNALGNIKIGIAIFTIFQMILMSVTVAIVTIYLEYIGVSEKVTKWVRLFYILFPPIGMWAITMLKDPLFSISHVLLTILLLEAVRTGGTIFKNIKYNIALFVISIMYMFTRNQGPYFIVILSIAMIFIYKKYWKQLLFIFIGSLFIVKGVFGGIIQPYLNIAPGGKQEMLGVFFQQTARYVKEWESEVTEKEREIIDKVLDYDSLIEKYNPTLQDPVKFTFRQHATTEELVDYFKVWFKQFVKHPTTYITATLNNIIKFYYLDIETGYAYTSLNETFKKGVPDIDYTFSEKEILSSGRDVATYLLKVYRKIPVINILLTPASFSWIVIGSFLVMMQRNKRKYFLAFLPTILSIVLFVICPVSNWRYHMPVILVTPVLIAFLLWNEKPNYKDDKE